MVLSLRRSGAALLAAVALGLVLPVAPAHDAAAQGAQSGAGPTAQPWDDRVNRFYSRGNPQRELEDAKRRLYDDPLRRLNQEPLRRLGLPENRRAAPSPSTGPTAPPRFDPGVSTLDRNADGAISREEYFQGRTRVVTPGFRGEQRHRRAQERLDSQFRNVDRNRDGVVTPDELKGRSRF